MRSRGAFGDALDSMAAHAPQIVNLICAVAAAVAMVVLGRGTGMLEERRPKRCAACSRLTDAGGRCAHCR
jgi:hypothetical protein